MSNWYEEGCAVGCDGGLGVVIRSPRRSSRFRRPQSLEADSERWRGCWGSSFFCHQFYRELRRNT